MFDYMFKATLKREGVHDAEEILFDEGCLTINRLENRRHHRVRGNKRLGTSINWVLLKLELETINGKFRLESRASKVRRGHGNEETINMVRSADFF